MKNILYPRTMLEKSMTKRKIFSCELFRKISNKDINKKIKKRQMKLFKIYIQRDFFLIKSLTFYLICRRVTLDPKDDLVTRKDFIPCH